MIDVESTVFDIVATAFSAEYPSGSRYGEPVNSPASFPCLTLVETDNYTYERSLDAEHKEHDAWLTYDINIYSNKTSGAKQECKSIMELVDNKMQELGFTRMFCNQMKNTETLIYRITARYRAVISENYILYRR
jgi:hypothetical protein